jgi:Ca2+-binding EF-hand superfamily protein
MKYYLLLPTVIALSFTVSACAINSASFERGSFLAGAAILNEMDLSSDGRITGAESIEYYEMKFMNLDTDGDGVLRQAEFDAYNKELEEKSGRQSKRGRMPRGVNFSDLDIDKNLVLSLEEFADWGEKRFAQLDNDEDGEITQSDIPQRISSKSGSEGQKGTGGGKGGGGRRGRR